MFRKKTFTTRVKFHVHVQSDNDIEAALRDPRFEKYPLQCNHERHMRKVVLCDVCEYTVLIVTGR